MFPIFEADSSADAMEECLETLIVQSGLRWPPVAPLVTLLEVSNSMNSGAIRIRKKQWCLEEQELIMGVTIGLIL